MSQKIPNVFIIGAPKSGTTTLFEILKSHTDVFTPRIKETHFFSHKEIESTYYKPVQVIKTKAEYLELYKKAHQKVILDATPNYLFYGKNVATKIKAFNSDAKIIIILRHPTSRALSHYLMDKNLGFYNYSILNIFNNKEKYPKEFEQIFSNSCYTQKILEYKEVFSDEQVLILNYDNLKNNYNAIKNELCKFLAIDVNLLSNVENVSFNKSYRSRLPFQKIMRNHSWLIDISHILPSGLKGFIKKILQSNVKTEFSHDEIKTFNQYFEKELKSLESYFKIKFD